MPEAKREHHPWGWPFVWLWLKICFLRVMSYIDVWCSDHLRPKPNEDVCVEKIRFPSRDKGRFLTAYVYTPKKLPSGPQPVHVNVHGSGFCTLHVRLTQVFMRSLAIRVGFATGWPRP